jgi:hypothetical protein
MLTVGGMETMTQRLGDITYWTAFYCSAFFAALAVWALMNLPISHPINFASNVSMGLVATMLVASLARKF